MKPPSHSRQAPPCPSRAPAPTCCPVTPLRSLEAPCYHVPPASPCSAAVALLTGHPLDPVPSCLLDMRPSSWCFPSLPGRLPFSPYPRCSHLPLRPQRHHLRACITSAPAPSPTPACTTLSLSRGRSRVIWEQPPCSIPRLGASILLPGERPLSAVSNSVHVKLKS